MNSRRTLFIAALTVALAATMSCEDTDVTAPENSAITLTASDVFIDQDAGETEGETTLVAQVVDPNGIPLEEVPLFFTTTGGLLASASGGVTQAIETNENGVAVDSLTLRLIEDPDEVTVTVKGTNLEISTMVTKIVNLGPVDPIANIVADPPGGQRTGLPFQFDGSGSSFDPLVELECFEWSILSSKLVFDNSSGVGCAECAVPGNAAICDNSCVARGANLSVLTLLVGDEGDPTLDQDLSVTLRVSDDPTILCADGTLTPEEDAKFSPFPDTLSYQLDCDLTDPVVEAGGNQSGSLSASGGTVSLTLTATASDPEDPALDFVWDCGNGTGGNQQSVTCNYTSQGIFTATVTVTNDCGRQEQDGLVVDIDP